MSPIPAHASFVSLARSAWVIFQDHFKTYFLIGLVIYLPLNLLLDISAPRNLDFRFLARQPMGEWDPLIWVNLTITLISVLIGLVGTAAVIITTKRALHHETTSLSTAVHESIQFWPRLLGTNLLMFVLVVIGFLFFVLPGLALALLFLFSSYAVVLADKWGMQALLFSSKLVGRHLAVVISRLLGLLVLVGLPSFVITYFSSLVASYGIPAIGNTLVDIITMYGTIFLTLLFLELEQTLLHVEKKD